LLISPWKRILSGATFAREEAVCWRTSWLLLPLACADELAAGADEVEGLVFAPRPVPCRESGAGVAAAGVGAEDREAEASAAVEGEGVAAALEAGAATTGAGEGEAAVEDEAFGDAAAVGLATCLEAAAAGANVALSVDALAVILSFLAANLLMVCTHCAAAIVLSAMNSYTRPSTTLTLILHPLSAPLPLVASSTMVKVAVGIMPRAAGAASPAMDGSAPERKPGQSFASQ